MPTSCSQLREAPQAQPGVIPICLRLPFNSPREILYSSPHFLGLGHFRDNKVQTGYLSNQLRK